MNDTTQIKSALTTQIKPASLGSISHGTLRTNDLLSAFISELEWQVSRNGDFFAMPENHGQRDNLANLIGEAQDCFADNGNEIDELVNETLPDALQDFCGSYVYFGTHIGDGSDFGFWPDVDAINELPIYEGTDEAKAEGETGDFRVVTDHGNVEVYSADGTSIIGIV